MRGVPADRLTSHFPTTPLILLPTKAGLPARPPDKETHAFPGPFAEREPAQAKRRAACPNAGQSDRGRPGGRVYRVRPPQGRPRSDLSTDKSNKFKHSARTRIEPGEPLLPETFAILGETRVFFGSDFPHLDHASDIVGTALGLPLEPAVLAGALGGEC